MKRFLLSISIATIAMCAMAEAGDMAAGLQFHYASKNSMVGLGAQFQIEPVRNVRVAPEFIYYFKDSGIDAYNVNINLHYLIRSYGGSVFYPIAGFSYANFEHDPGYGTGKYSWDRCGANIGIGYEYRINDRFTFYTEERFQILKDWNQSVTTLGLKFNF